MVEITKKIVDVGGGNTPPLHPSINQLNPTPGLPEMIAKINELVNQMNAICTILEKWGLMKHTA